MRFLSGSIQIGRLFGIPFSINYSWIGIFTLVTITLALHYFPTNYPEWSTAAVWVVALTTSLLFFSSVVAHELAHSAVARAQGIPVKNITLFIFGGVAQITREAARPRNELLMALAGPAASLLAAAGFFTIYIVSGVFSVHLQAITWWLALINLSLAVFNLLPGFPLDGGRVLRAVLWGVTGSYRRASRAASMAGQALAYTFIFFGIAWIFFGGGLINGLWLVFIGWFLENAASSSYRQAVLRESLEGHTAREMMRTDCTTVSPTTTLAELMESAVLSSGRRCFLVTEDETLRGIITLHNFRAVDRRRWNTTTVREAMTRVEDLKMVHPNAGATDVLETMDDEDVNQVPVVQDGTLVGMIGRDDLLRFIRTRIELGI